MNPNVYKGYGAIFLCTLLYGWYGVLIKLMGTHIPIFYQATYRNLLASFILMIILIVARDASLVVSRSDIKLIVLRSLCGICALVLSYYGFLNLPIGLSYLFSFSTIIITSFILGAILNKERMTKIKIAAFLLVLAGLLVTYADTQHVNGGYVYIGIVSLSGVFSAIWNIFPKYISSQVSAIKLNLFDSLVVAIVAVLISWILRESIVTPSFDLAWIANTAFAGIFVITGVLIPYGFRHVEAQTGSIIMPLEIVFGIALGFIVLRDPVSFSMVVGSMLIMSAAMLPYVAELLSTKRNRMQ